MTIFYPDYGYSRLPDFPKNSRPIKLFIRFVGRIRMAFRSRAIKIGFGGVKAQLGIRFGFGFKGFGLFYANFPRDGCYLKQDFGF